ncbi:MAG: flagellar biosynthetic protein FliR, partial [Gallionella sp.]|nr:flagellar biosynthetic protein FliR [Gallionella sp.]
GLLIVVQQIIIGTAMGLTLRMIFNAFEMAGELAGLQMGLGFASFYDPQNASYSPVIAQWLGITASLAFLALNGHLIIISALAESFHTLPVGEMMPAKGYYSVAAWGGNIFSYGVQIALPILAALLITNLALGILTRAAQQLNPFAIGFPITLGIGFFILSFTLPYLPALLEHVMQDSVDSALSLLK